MTSLVFCCGDLFDNCGKQAEPTLRGQHRAPAHGCGERSSNTKCVRAHTRDWSREDGDVTPCFCQYAPEEPSPPRYAGVFQLGNDLVKTVLREAFIAHRPDDRVGYVVREASCNKVAYIIVHSANCREYIAYST